MLIAYMLGLTWVEIRDQYLQSKTPKACIARHRWLMGQQERGANGWDPSKLHNLAKEYMSMHEDIWSGLAARLGEDWRVVEEKVPPLSVSQPIGYRLSHCIHVVYAWRTSELGHQCS